MKRTIRLLFLLVVMTGIIFAQEGIPKLKDLLEFGNLKLKEIKRGNIDFEIEITGLENFRGRYSKLNQQRTFASSKEINLSRGQKSSENLIIEDMQENEIRMVSIYIETPEAPAGYNKSYYKYYYVKKVNGNYEIIDPNIIDKKSIRKIGEDIKIGKGQNAILRTSQNYNVNISGKINIAGIQKGLYGNGVALWFRNTNNPSTWYHPIVGTQQNVHYCILDEQGNFNFNFNFSGDLSNYNQAIVIVNTANAAAYLPTPSNGYTSWGPNGYTSYFNEAEGVVVPINGSNSNIYVVQNGVINANSGEVLRYMMFARELSIQRYNGNCPFNIPPISAAIKNLPYGGHFVVAWSDLINGYVHYIEIDPSSTDFTTVSHEYGHYINFLMWGRERFSFATKEVKEGWAIFYSFATRNYANKLYGDYFDDYDDNTERAPFYRNTTRYENIRYAYPSNNKPEYAAVACYLWNAYDSYAGGNFEQSNLDIGDNDDISGQANLLFEVFRQLPQSVIGLYPIDRDHLHSFFYNSTIQNLKLSTNDLYSFMYSDLYNIPVQKMRSAQINNFNGNIVSNNQINFNWNSRSYSTGTSYQNKETGYKLYYKNGSNWELLATLNNTQTNYSYTSPNINKEYKFTSYNATGESGNPLYIIPLSATISGSSSLQINQNGTWNCSASGGTPPYSYQWHYQYPLSDIARSGALTRKPPKGVWYTLGTNSSSLTRYDNENFELKCVITDATGAQKTSNIHSVYVSGTATANLQKELTGEKVLAEIIPETTKLFDCYPNPFNPSTTIKYDIQEAGEVVLKVYDITGREVKTLVDERKEPGRYSVTFDGSKCSSGMYIYTLKTKDYFKSKKFQLIK